MSIIIQNLGKFNNKTYRYRINIDKKFVCEFFHERTRNGLSTCLREAADAIDKIQSKERKDSVKDFFNKS